MDFLVTSPKGRSPRFPLVTALAALLLMAGPVTADLDRSGAAAAQDIERIQEQERRIPTYRQDQDRYYQDQEKGAQERAKEGWGVERGTGNYYGRQLERLRRGSEDYQERDRNIEDYYRTDREAETHERQQQRDD